MGGLIIKKSYMLGRQNPAHESLTKRFHAIYFLGTPHRGSEAAKLMNNVLEYAYSSSPLLAELEEASAITQAIDEEFEQYSSEMELWSFYETQKLKIGLLSKLNVSPESAILGYDGERKMPMKIIARFANLNRQTTQLIYLSAMHLQPLLLLYLRSVRLTICLSYFIAAENGDVTVSLLYTVGR